VTRPWDGVVPQHEVDLHAQRGGAVDRTPSWGSKPAVIVVDMTREFVDSAYATGWSPTGQPAAAANVSLLESARDAGIPVYYTRQIMQARAPMAMIGPRRWTSTRVDASPTLPLGGEIADAISPHPTDVVVDKPKPSAFFGTPLLSMLIAEGIDTVIVTGMVTSGCVRATAIDGYMNNFSVVVVEEATADWSDFQHRTALFDLHMKYADVVSLAEVLVYLTAVHGRIPDVVST
jgi:nicotinamidase-related amidase